VLIKLNTSLQILNLDIIPPSGVIPVRANNLVLSFDVVFEMILLGKRVEVRIDLFAAGIHP